MTRLADLTTLRLGGPARAVIDCRGTDSLMDAVQRCDAAGEPILVLGGGSNVVAADAGFPGTVIRVLTAGIEQREEGDCALLSVQAGESWDRLVDQCVQTGLAGIECLAGIPGSTGATPIQNVGAYGQEVAQTILCVTAFDRWTREIRRLSRVECEFSYRSSLFKRQSDRWVVMEVDFALSQAGASRAIGYAELARCLGIPVGGSAPLRQVRDAVVQLRRAKGMVLDPIDPDTWSAGSFFLNPILDEHELVELRARVHTTCGPKVEPPVWATDAGKVKTSAAWLIERAGFHRGYGSAHGIAISSKHTLALTNRGSGSSMELVDLAREIAGTVRRRFGIELTPEPVFVGQTWCAP